MAKMSKIPKEKWVCIQNLKPEIGEEVLVTNCDGRRDICEWVPGEGLINGRYAWGNDSQRNIFWRIIPEDPVSDTMFQ